MSKRITLFNVNFYKGSVLVSVVSQSHPYCVYKSRNNVFPRTESCKRMRVVALTYTEEN